MMTAVLMIMSVIFAFMAGQARSEENWSEMRCMLALWALTFALFIERLGS